MKTGSRESGVGNRHGAQAPSPRFCHSRRPSGSPPAGFPTPHSRHQGGFSLLEVIAAIMLLAIAFTALMKVAGASISLTQNAAEHSQAAMRARSLLDSAFVGEPIKPGSSSGRFDRQYRWQLDVTPWNEAGNAPPGTPLHLYQLDLDVSWGAPAHPRSAHFRTLRLGGPNVAASAQAFP